MIQRRKKERKKERKIKKERKKERKEKNDYSVLYSILKFDQTYKKMEYMYTYLMVRTNNYIVY